MEGMETQDEERRLALTQPSVGVSNEGHDNETSDLIL